MRPSSPSLPERDFTLEALKQGNGKEPLRLDGRKPLDIRPIEFTFGPELGWVEMSLGKTRVLAQVDAKMVKPPEERPLEGILTIHSEISPMASSDFEIGRASEEEVLITRMLEKVIRRSDAVDKESLCILAGQRVWHLRLTLHFLADAGNMMDCACLAGIVALKHFRRPEVEVIGDEVTVFPPLERAPVSLAMHHTPICLTFAYLTPPPSHSSSSFASTSISQKDANQSASSASPAMIIPPILDPSRLEQTLSTGTLSLALTAQRELCVVQKAGGVPIAPDEVLELMGIAIEKVKYLEELIETKLKLDWRQRVVEFVLYHSV